MEVIVDGPAQLPPNETHPLMPPISASAASLTEAPVTPPIPSTPSDIVSSKWRTLRCPMAPCPRRSDRDESGLSSPCSGLITPNNVWNWLDTPGVQTPQPGEKAIHDDLGKNSECGATPPHANTQFGVSPTALSLAIGSAKLGATLPHREGPSVCRVLARHVKRAATVGCIREEDRVLEACVETGLTVDSLPDLAPDVDDGSGSEVSLSPRSIRSDGSDGRD